MSIHFNCSNCKTAYKVPEDVAGRATTCRQCKAPIVVPNTAIRAGEPIKSMPRLQSNGRGSGGWIIVVGGGGIVLLLTTIILIIVVGQMGSSETIAKGDNEKQKQPDEQAPSVPPKERPVPTEDPVKTEPKGKEEIQPVVQEKPNAPLPKPEEKEKPKPISEWVDASKKTAQQGNIVVTVTSVTVDFTRVSDLGRLVQSREKHLQIRLTIANNSETKKVEYLGWGHKDAVSGLSERRAVLNDNFGNRHHLIGFGFGRHVQGQVILKDIYPGKSVEDVLVFDMPVDRMEFLRLELPASAFGGSGHLWFEIPRRMVAWDK